MFGEIIDLSQVKDHSMIEWANGSNTSGTDRCRIVCWNRDISVSIVVLLLVVDVLAGVLVVTGDGPGCNNDAGGLRLSRARSSSGFLVVPGLNSGGGGSSFSSDDESSFSE